MTSIAIHQNKIIGSCYDKVIRIWNLDTGKIVSKMVGFVGHANSVAVVTQTNKIVCGFSDKVIKIWDFEKCNQK